MTDDTEQLPEVIEEQVPQRAQVQANQPVMVPMYRRNLNPSNLVLSADDLKEFAELVVEVNERAKSLEFAQLNLNNFDSPEQARQRVNEVVPVEYNYKAQNGDYVQGLGVPNTGDRNFPDELMTIFLSNAAFSDRAANLRPLNTVEVFLSFEKPSLKIDFQSMPSNPTDNRSVINVEGRDEAWVIATTQKIEEFFQKRKATRPIIHGSGTYDYLVYLAFLPAVIWLFYKQGTSLTSWLQGQSVFLNVILGIYGFLLTLLFARFVFQYVRWLFPPM
ncbi:MAG: hypothetical protein Q4P24_15665 [Rhodobacterales bacterium]|nr:hypothetical protein [Rhodobacterales bacterium]